MRWRCRCNKRPCQARKTFAKHPDEYKHGRPKCHIPGCKGIMYPLKDQTLKERGSGIICYADCLPFRHRISDRRCYQHEEYTLNKNGGGVKDDEPNW